MVGTLVQVDVLNWAADAYHYPLLIINCDICTLQALG